MKPFNTSNTPIGKTKTRTGENPRGIRPVKPRMYENENKERCPVQLNKAFAQRRPEDCNNADCLFYLAVNNVKERNETQAWFKRKPLELTNCTQ